jgi:hypothetical protein
VTWGAGLHWSYSNRAWCGLFAALADGRILCRHELTWLRTPPEVASKELAARVKPLEFSSCIAQPDLWPKPDEVGETIAETFSRAGVPMRRGIDDRINGWSRVRSWLVPREWTDADGKAFTSPSLLIHPDCAYLLRTLPTLIEDSAAPDDIPETPEAFPANGLRYFAMSRPMPKPAEAKDLPPGAIGHSLRSAREELAAAEW